MPNIPNNVNGRDVNVGRIDMSGNLSMCGNFASSWRSLRNLKYIDLSNTGLGGNIPDDWNDLNGLEEVHITNTAACRGLPKWSGFSMPPLRVVDLRNNRMAETLSASWPSFTALTSVQLSGNTFCGCAPASWSADLRAAIGDSAAATSASCTANWCTSSSWRCGTTPNGNGVNPGGSTSSTNSPAARESDTMQLLRALGAATGMTWSGDDYCAFSSITCPGNTSAGGERVTVALGGHALSASQLPRLSGLDGGRVMVVEIDLSRNRGIAGTFPESWAALVQLEKLDLSGTNLRGDISSAWNGMFSLQEVRIRDTLACRNLPNWRVGSMPSLRVVDFSSNPNMRGVLTESFSTLALTDLTLTSGAACGCIPYSWQWQPVMLATAEAAGVPAPGSAACRTNGCRGPSFTCPAVQRTTTPPPAEDPPL